MIHIIAFSGGVDSTALLLWAFKNLPHFRVVFCDTGWESNITYAYVRLINERLLQGKLIYLRSDTYENGMMDLVQRKRRVPSAKARFCTEKLKIAPMIAYFNTLDDEYTLYQGIRADESPKRREMGPRSFSQEYDCEVVRPLFDYTKHQVFDLLREAGIAPNPMYKRGAARVGCFPCVMAGHGEMRRLTLTMPEVWDRIKQLESVAIGSRGEQRTFFPPRYIPARFCSRIDPHTQTPIPTAEDVRGYLFRKDIDKAELERWENEKPQACLSVYNLCE